MTGQTPLPLPGKWLQALAKRQSPATRRVLLSIVADLHFEWQSAQSASGRRQVRVRGAWAFARAVVPALVEALARRLRDVTWGGSPQDRGTARRLAFGIALATTAWTVLMMFDLARGLSRIPLEARSVLPLLLPGVVSVAIPMGCLLGIVTAGRSGHPGSRPGWGPLLRVTGLAALLTFAVAGWWAPRSNQTYRERVFAALVPGGPAGGPAAGDRELTFVELRSRAAALRSRGETARADMAALEWHKKPALALSCLALALAGVSLTRLVRGVTLRVLLSLPLVGLIGALFRLGEQWVAAGRVQPVVAMWGPVTVLSGISALAALLARRRLRSPSPASPGRV